MHVILNVESLVKPSGGIGRYTKHLLEGFIKSDDIDKVSCFAEHHWTDGAEFLAGINKPLVHTALIQSSVKSQIRLMIRSVPFVYQAYTFYRSKAFNFRAKAYCDAIYQEPNFILKPFQGIAIPTIHDLSHLHFPQYHPKERVDFMNKNLSGTISRADHILTDSEFIKNELVQILNVDKERITAIPLGVDLSFHPRSENELKPVLSKYNLLPDRYLLSLSTLEPRKNIIQMLDSYMSLKQSIREEYPLVIVGGDGWNNSDIKYKIKALENSGHIKYIGYVTDNDLPYIVAGARSFVFIPFYEGFGLPPLEAMASGIPVLTSNVSSLSEVVADSGLMVEPGDNDAIVYNLEKVLTDKEWRNKAVAKGLKQSKQFHWDNCVDKTIKIYKNLLATR